MTTKHHIHGLVPCLVLSLLVALTASNAGATATITIINNNAAGVGFNDPTPVAPIGGQPQLPQSGTGAPGAARSDAGAMGYDDVTNTAPQSMNAFTLGVNAAVTSGGRWTHTIVAGVDEIGALPIAKSQSGAQHHPEVTSLP